MAEVTDEEKWQFILNELRESLDSGRVTGEAKDDGAGPLFAGLELRDSFIDWCGRQFQEANLVRSYQAVGWEHRPKNLRMTGVHAYSLSDDESVLRIFFFGLDPVEKAHDQGAVFEAMFGPTRRFIHYCLESPFENFLDDLATESPEFELTTRLRALGKSRTLKKVIFTGTVRQSIPRMPFDSHIEQGIMYEYDQWNLTRLYQLATGYTESNDLCLDLNEIAGETLDYLQISHGDERYQSYLTAFSGDLLAKIFAAHSERILEANVRNFLQAKGTVNTGIQQTIKDDSGSFFAFNNGLSTVASKIEFAETESGPRIAKLHNLQIVNGAQTTGSIHHAMKSGVDVSQIRVPVKITEIADDVEMRHSFVLDICRYANTQNAVKTSDHFSNYPFQIELQRLSQRIAAPPQYNKYWYYERLRGQYESARRKSESTKAFDEQFPRQQVLHKTDVARYLLNWEGLPYIVSLGAQRNFEYFMETWLPENHGHDWQPDKQFFTALIGKKLIHDVIDRVVRQDKKIANYQVHVVNYTMAIIAEHAGEKFRLRDIWSMQAIPEAFLPLIRELARKVYAFLQQSSMGINISEWCKREACWEQALEISLPKQSKWVTRGLQPEELTKLQVGTIAPTTETDAELAQQFIAELKQPESDQSDSDQSESGQASDAEQAKPKTKAPVFDPRSIVTRNAVLTMRQKLAKAKAKKDVLSLVNQRLRFQIPNAKAREKQARLFLNYCVQVFLAPEDVDAARRGHVSKIRRVIAKLKKADEADFLRIIVNQCLAKRRATKKLISEAMTILRWAEAGNVIARSKGVVRSKYVKPADFTTVRLGKVIAANIEPESLIFNADIPKLCSLFCGLNVTKTIRERAPKIKKYLVNAGYFEDFSSTMMQRSVPEE